jgi:hypothetical protein
MRKPSTPKAVAQLRMASHTIRTTVGEPESSVLPVPVMSDVVAVAQHVVGRASRPRNDTVMPSTPPSQVWFGTMSRITSIPAACSASTIARNSSTSAPGTLAYPGWRREEAERGVAQ